MKKIIIIQEICTYQETLCVVRSEEEMASGHVEWHSNREDTPIVPPQRNNRKNQKQLKKKKISGDIPELVPEDQQSFTTNRFYFPLCVIPAFRLKIFVFRVSRSICSTFGTKFLKDSLSHTRISPRWNGFLLRSISLVAKVAVATSLSERNKKRNCGIVCLSSGKSVWQI